jgi:hypothetical protein
LNLDACKYPDARVNRTTRKYRVFGVDRHFRKC